VARFEPENHVEVAVQGHVASGARKPLVVVGSAPYSDEYTRRVHDAAAGDERVRFLGGVWDQDQLDQLYAHALTYVHGHSVGGTNPSLLRAIGAGAATLAFDVSFNREVLGEHGRYFTTAANLAGLLVDAEQDPAAVAGRGRSLQDRARDYDWDAVADGYERLARDLRAGRVPGPQRARRRTAATPPTPVLTTAGDRP
jgi:glycosyltransferase involved in cell wall biosynthesis